MLRKCSGVELFECIEVILVVYDLLFSHFESYYLGLFGIYKPQSSLCINLLYQESRHRYVSHHLLLAQCSKSTPLLSLLL